MNKNWNDRADKDLFFTILSVKNIGVISGAEWTNIGHHMRSIGYGFTNEGCRQHFQGLRRAQHKSESTKSSLDSQRKEISPGNPVITRRPGPGRGRPRKLPPAPLPDTQQAQPQPKENTPPETLASNPLPAPSAPVNAPTDEPVTSSRPTKQLRSSPDVQEQPSKRQRLEVDVEASVGEAVSHVNSDEAALVLAADGIASAVEDYPPEYYGEA
ncbi:hypothetical protein GGS20DRAFT_571680 [Poronia punctata]|nr:hypothetical protein GGS20DRAFT_571680 [Poronia punctata]